MDQMGLDLVEMGAGEPPRTSSRLHRALAGAIALLFAVSVLGLVLRSGSEADAGAELAGVRSFLQSATTVRFEARIEDAEHPPEDGPGQTFTTVEEMGGELVMPDRFHAISDDGDLVSEMIVIGPDWYSREGDDRALLAKERWVKSTDADLGGSAIQMTAGVSGIGDMAYTALSNSWLNPLGPSDLRALVAGLEHPTRLSEGVLRAEMTLPAGPMRGGWFGYAPNTIQPPPPPKASAELTSGPGGRLDRLVITVTQAGTADMDSSRTTADLHFRDWGGPIQVDAPGAGQIDPTPEFDEEAIAAVTAFEVLAPASLPPNLRLASGYHEPADTDDETCESVSLQWIDPIAAQRRSQQISSVLEAARAAGREPDFEAMDEAMMAAPESDVDLSFSAASCEDVFAEEDGEPIAVGGVTGSIARPTGDFPSGTSITFQRGRTRIQVHSGMSEAELVKLVARLVPFDMAKQRVLTPEEGHAIFDR
jgi:hypothetical protein